MRLQAKLTPMRVAERRGAGLRATLRDPGDTPSDIEIIDISDTGFLAELPADMAVEPGTSVRIAAAPIGRHVAFAVRAEGRRHGFAFERPLARGTLDKMAGITADTVVPFGSGAAVAAPAIATPPLPSARTSLIGMTGVAALLWCLLAILLVATARFA